MHHKVTFGVINVRVEIKVKNNAKRISSILRSDFTSKR